MVAPILVTREYLSAYCKLPKFTGIDQRSEPLGAPTLGMSESLKGHIVSNYSGIPAGSLSPPSDTNLIAPSYRGISKKRKRFKGLVMGLAASLALALGGGGAWAATQYLSTDGTDTAARLPESTSAFASFNLDVSKDQQKQLLDLVAKFPASAVNSDAPQEAVSQFLGMLEKTNKHFADGNFADWVGPNASVAQWQHKGEPYALATVSSIDDAKADKGLAALKAAGGTGQVGYEIKDGYATIAFGEKDAQTAVKSAVSEAEGSPLSESGQFAKAADFLGEGQVFTAWADLEKSNELFQKQQPKDGMIGDALPFDVLKGLSHSMKGQVAFGAKAQDYGIEAVSSTFGAKDVPEGKDGMMDRLSEVPESDIAAAAALPDDVKESMVMAVVSGLLGIDTSLNGPILDQFFDLLSGASGTLGVSGVTGPVPTGQASIDTGSPAKAHALKAVADLAGGALDTSVDGSTITGSTLGYPDDTKTSDNKYYGDAVGGAVDNINCAAFLDMTKLLDGQAKQALSALKAVGLTLGNKDGESVGNYRMIVD